MRGEDEQKDFKADRLESRKLYVERQTKRDNAMLRINTKKPKKATPEVKK